jgi:tetratricopeptide (TPR) repeat protein
MSNCLKIIFIAFFISACQTVPIQEASQVQPEATIDPILIPEAKAIDINQKTYEEAVEALKNNQIDFAIELLIQVTTSAPELEFAFTNLGLAYFKLEDFKQSEQTFQKAISTNIYDSVSYNHLGIIQRLHGDFANAKTSYEKAVSINNDYADAYLNLGTLYDIYLQDLNPALKQYEKYQSLTNNENKLVKGWITDIQRQLKANKKKTKG